MTNALPRRAVALLTALTLLAMFACSKQPIEQPAGSVVSPLGQRITQPIKAVYRPDLFPQQTTVPFTESMVQPLESGVPSADAKLVFSFPLPNSEASIQVYSGADSGSGWTGYAAGKHSKWKLGSLSGIPREEAGQIAALNFLTGDRSGAVLNFPFGDIGARKGIAVYDRTADTWKIVDFQGHEAVEMDIDKDGTPEWVGNQTRWVPPALEIHQWSAEKGHFESAVLQWEPDLFPGPVRNTPSYSSLFEENGVRFIEIGDDEAYAFFTYEQGMLKQYRPDDTRSRVLEMRQVRRYGER
ncbi:hypothetical protein [Paenibacillus solanacearum]|uniref:hypothetical protein n=1 Tax=Paenibacillus solanacearum TaxID=2048548 RepID=UPI001C401E1B|nr:hypothetical protein [Paenibacillus solanacearum]